MSLFNPDPVDLAILCKVAEKGLITFGYIRSETVAKQIKKCVSLGWLEPVSGGFGVGLTRLGKHVLVEKGFCTCCGKRECNEEVTRVIARA